MIYVIVNESWKGKEDVVKISYKSFSDALLIESKVGKAKVSTDVSNNIKIDGEEVLHELGLSVGDVIAMYFDRTTNEKIKNQYPIYRDRQGRKDT